MSGTSGDGGGAAAEAVRDHVGERPTATHPLPGAAFVHTLSSGNRVVAKRGQGPGATAAEAAGLRWLGEHADVAVPSVAGHDPEWLVTDYVPSGQPSRSGAEAFGSGLARMHLRGAPSFGSPPPDGPSEAWIGLAGMSNQPEADWPTFYARHRVLPYVRRAVDQGRFDREQAAVFERACEHLPELGGSDETPARLHGDAWSGNVHWDGNGRAWLLDPAAHGGHRETDLAMLALFGLPMLDRVLGSYHETAEQEGAALATGRQERVRVHQLFPLLVHTVLFGGGYGPQALAAARSLA